MGLFDKPSARQKADAGKMLNIIADKVEDGLATAHGVLDMVNDALASSQGVVDRYVNRLREEAAKYSEQAKAEGHSDDLTRDEKIEFIANAIDATGSSGVNTWRMRQHTDKAPDSMVDSVYQTFKGLHG